MYIRVSSSDSHVVKHLCNGLPLEEEIMKRRLKSNCISIDYLILYQQFVSAYPYTILTISKDFIASSTASHEFLES